MNIEKALKESTDLTPKEFIEKAIEGGWNRQCQDAEFSIRMYNNNNNCNIIEKGELDENTFFNRGVYLKYS